MALELTAHSERNLKVSLFLARVQPGGAGQLDRWVAGRFGRVFHGTWQALLLPRLLAPHLLNGDNDSLCLQDNTWTLHP